jgi:hypothetical protein
MTKRRGATSDNGFIFKKLIKIKREKKILWAVFEIIPFIHFYPLQGISTWTES